MLSRTEIRRSCLLRRLFEKLRGYWSESATVACHCSSARAARSGGYWRRLTAQRPLPSTARACQPALQALKHAAVSAHRACRFSHPLTPLRSRGYPDGCSIGSDYQAHGNTPFVAWYLQQMKLCEQQHGVRILDYLDLHAYIGRTLCWDTGIPIALPSSPLKRG